MSKKDLIANDVSRCTNHRCDKNLKCKRYVQMKIDYLEKGIPALHNDKFPYTRFSSFSCLNYLEISKWPHTTTYK